MKTSFTSKKYFPIVALVAMVTFIIPHVSFAAPTAVINLVSLLESIISALFPVIVAIGILVFGYNIGKYLTSKDLADQNLYKSGIVNSIIALAVVFTIFGIIKLLASSLGISTLGVGITVSNPDAGLGSGTADGINTFRYYALEISKFISGRIIPIMVASALLFFVGNVVISMTKSDVEAERTKLNQYLRWGVVALFILLTLFSVVGFFTGSLFGTGAIIPQFPTSDSG